MCIINLVYIALYIGEDRELERIRRRIFVDLIVPRGGLVFSGQQKRRKGTKRGRKVYYNTVGAVSFEER